MDNKQLYKITLTREQLMLISQCVEDISRFAAGDMDLQHTTDTLIDDMDRTESLGIRSFIVEIILDNTPARQGEIWTDERSTHDEEYFSIEDHNSAIVLPKGTIRRLTGRDLKWEDDPISLKSKSVIDKFPHADIEFYKQKIINFVEWI